MANLVLAFGEVLVGAIILDAGIKGDSIPNVIKGQATQHALTDGTTSGAGGADASLPASGAGNYTNPVPGATTGRIDAGVDYTLSPSGFLAPGRSQILVADRSNSGWKGGGYIAAKLLDGPLAGMVYYVAEGITPAAGVTVGAIVNAGQQLVTRATNPYNGTLGNIEAGWASSSNPLVPAGFVGNTNDQGMPALTQGYSFSQFVKGLGGVSGVFQGAGAALASTIEHAAAGLVTSGIPG